MSDSRLVYSTDPARNRQCPRCKNLIPECQCRAGTLFGKEKPAAVMRIEKSGRGGKVVTVIARLPRVESYLKDLARKLKARCGSGGTHYVKPEGGVIEIQGDKRELLRKILTAEGIQTKG